MSSLSKETPFKKKNNKVEQFLNKWRHKKTKKQQFRINQINKTAIKKQQLTINTPSNPA